METEGTGVGLRVMTYNLRTLRHGIERVADAIEASAPDLVLVQESGGRLAFPRLARRLGMTYANDPARPFRRRIKDAILVRPPLRIEQPRQHRLPRSQFLYPRGVLTARIVGPAGSLWVASVHLGMRPHDRRRHADDVIAICGDRHPLVLGGDLNEAPGKAATEKLARALTDAWAAAGSGVGETIYAWDRRLRIDYLFVSGDVEPVRSWVPDDAATLAASDHLPVVADLRVGLAADRAGAQRWASAPSAR